MRYRVRHTTSLQYEGPVSLARMNLRLNPAPWPGQRLIDYHLDITPAPALVEEAAGPWIVNRHRISFAAPLARLTIESRFEVEVAPPSFALDMAVGSTVAQLRAAALSSGDLSAMSPASYLYASPLADDVAEIAEWAAPFFTPETPVIDAGEALMRAIHHEFRYDDEATDVRTPPREAFRQRRGVCQDFAHVMIVAARGAGIPAAYISGYLRTLPPAGQPRLIGADATHAWAALWCGEALGWVGFDPTNACLAASDHIFTAMGRDYADVAPVDGVFLGGGGQRVDVEVDVEPLD